MTAIIESLSLESKRRYFRSSYFWIIGVFYRSRDSIFRES